MGRNAGACLVCGKPLIYFDRAREMICESCGGRFLSNASCEDGHFVCDACHGKRGFEAVMEHCLESGGKNPVQLADRIMENAYIHMHGPEHHVMVGAALITAFHNAGGQVELKGALEEMLRRGKSCPGGTCGFWGCCGAAVSAGMFVSIVTNATPLTTDSWALANEMTSRTLARIAALGGPRCCKRNSYTAIIAAAEFSAEKLGVDMEMPEKIVCTFYEENRECKRRACPYYGGGQPQRSSSP